MPDDRSCVCREVITVGIDGVVELLCADRSKAYMVQVVFYGEKIPYTPYKGKRGKLLKVNAVILVAGMPGAYINTGFFSVKRNEFKFFVGQNVLELVELLLRNINDANFRKSLGYPVADLLHSAF